MANRRSGGFSVPGPLGRRGDSPTERQLLDAIRLVECGGRPPPASPGPAGERGPYQITAAAWTDACEFGGAAWDYDRLVWSAPHCEQIARWYWARHRAVTPEQKSRLWNGGPDWRIKPETVVYWARVQARLPAGGQAALQTTRAQNGTQRRARKSGAGPSIHAVAPGPGRPGPGGVLPGDP